MNLLCIVLKLIFFLPEVYVCLKLRGRTNDIQICPKMRGLGIVYNKQKTVTVTELKKLFNQYAVCLGSVHTHTLTNHFMSYISRPPAILISLELLKWHLYSRKAFENCHVDKVPMETTSLDIHVFNIPAYNFFCILIGKKKNNKTKTKTYTFLGI